MNLVKNLRKYIPFIFSMEWLFVSIALLSVASSGAEVITPDFSLVQKWNESIYKSHGFQPFPKIIRFEGKRSLTFVATKHKGWMNSQAKIWRAIREFKPEIILIEGIGKSDGVSPRIWDEKLKLNLNGEGLEDYFAYKLAIQEKIPFVGAELEGKMSDHSSYDRDIAVVKYIAELLSQNKNVMVVYGAGHYVQQEQVLIHMLGHPTGVQ